MSWSDSSWTPVKNTASASYQPPVTQKLWNRTSNTAYLFAVDTGFVWWDWLRGTVKAEHKYWVTTGEADPKFSCDVLEGLKKAEMAQ